MRWSADHAAMALCAASVAIYAWPLLDPARDWQFVIIWDDLENFVDNAVIKGLSPAHLRRIFSLVIINVWEPFGWLLKALVFAVVGLNSRATRIVTLVFHLCAAWWLAHTAALLLAIVYSVHQLTAHRKSGSAATGVSGSLTAATTDPKYHINGCVLAALALFVLHPVNVEVVAWPSTQPYALATFFSMLSLYFHSRQLYRVVREHAQRHAQSPRAARGASPESESLPSDWDRLVTLVAPSCWDRDTQISAVCFVAAVLSKSVCILLPVATVLIDALVVLPIGFTIHARTSYFPTVSQCVRYAVKYALGKALLACAAVTFMYITLAANKEGAGQRADIITLSLSQRVIKALSTPAWTMRSILWPVGLRPHYRLDEDDVTLSNPEYLLSVVSLPLLAAWLAARDTEFRIPSLLAVAYFCVMLLPTCGLIQHGIVAKGADRYGYFPMMALVPIVGHWLTQYLELEAIADEGTAERVVRSVGASNERNHNVPKATEARSRLVAGRAACRQLLFAVVTALLLTLDAHQMKAWENSEAHLEHSLRLDPVDSRLLHSAYEHKTRWGGGCAGDPQTCKNWLNLAYYYAPSKSERAKLYRYMILFLLGEQDKACEGFKLMKVEYPDSAVIESNMALCAFLHGRLEEARERIIHAQKLTIYNKHERQSVSANYFHMVPWIDAALTGRGEQKPFEAKLVW